jgi:predicted RecA/RadA family phage recombinase
MNNFKMSGITLTHIAAAAITSGQLVEAGQLIGVAVTDAAIGEEVELMVEGVFELPKTSADTPAEFANAYWDSSAGEVTTTATDNTLIGVFVNAYSAGDVLAEVRLNGVSV